MTHNIVAINGTNQHGSNPNQNGSKKNEGNDVEYEPVMLVRTRSNSIYSNSSTDDDYCEYDVMSVENNSHLTQYSDWIQYGILPNPKDLNELYETCCSLCGKEDESELHYKFFTGTTQECVNFGYNICFLCKFKFELVLKKRAEPIWDLLDNTNVPYLWAPRTRRDPVTNQRIYDGAYTYEKWRPVSKYVSFMKDSTRGYPGVENTPFIFCSIENPYEASISKFISVIDILKSNYNACKSGLYDTTYNPNDHDPINTLILSSDAKIKLCY
jgi:hypothetical protein